MKVLMIDMSSSTLPYDVHLSKGLLMNSELELCLVIHRKSNLILEQSNFKILKLYKLCSLVERVTKNTFLLRLVKLIEHPFTMAILLLYTFKLKPNVIHVQWTQFPAIDALYYRILQFFFPLVYTAHNSTVAHGETGLLARIQSAGMNGFVNLFSRVIVHTHKSKETFVRNYSFESSRVDVIPHGCLYVMPSAEKVRDKLKEKYKIQNETEVIVFFGNINHYKGLDILLNAFAGLKDIQKSKARVLITGKPRESMHRYFNICKHHHIEPYISWDLRYVPENMLDALYGLATIFVLPHRHIDQSGVLMSIIKYGKPIIASNADGFSEILTHNINALIFPINDVNQLSKRLEELIVNPEKKARLGLGVYSLYEEWPSWKEIAVLHERTYQHLSQ